MRDELDAERAASAQSVQNDPRTLAQIAADSFTQLLKLGADADPNTLFGGRRPVVRVIVTEHDRPATIPAPSAATPSAAAPSGSGAFGYLEGNPAPVSAETIARHLCETGSLGILFGQSGQRLNVGRDQRLFTAEQRQALAVRDGGCRWPGCEQPPSWSEAHHIENWLAANGLTNIDQAILLCTPHHLLLHNRGWKTLLHHDQYWLQPPADIDPEQTPIALPSKNPLLQPPLLDPPPANPRTAIAADCGSVADGGGKGVERVERRSDDDARPSHAPDDYRD